MCIVNTNYLRVQFYFQLTDENIHYIELYHDI